MTDDIKKLTKEILVLRKLESDNKNKIEQLLKIPEVREFYGIITDNEKIKNTLKKKEKEYTLKSMYECEHAFVITEIVRNTECGSIRRIPVYHCIKCGLTNEYDVKEVNNLVDEIKSQMALIFADTSLNGVLLSNEVIDLIEAIDIYKGIIVANQNINNSELKKSFSSSMVRKLTPPKTIQTNGFKKN